MKEKEYRNFNVEHKLQLVYIKYTEITINGNNNIFAETTQIFLKISTNQKLMLLLIFF